MKRILLPFAVAGIFMPLAAQNEAEVLQNYKYRFQQYRAYTFNANAGSHSFVSHWDQTNRPAEPWRSETTGNLNLGLSRWFISNTDREQKTNTFNFSHASSLGSPGYYSRGYSTRSDISWFAENRRYRSERNFLYYKVGAGVMDAHSRSRITTFGFNTWRGETRDDLSATADIELGFGRGRLEYVSDMSFAMFWLKEMREKGIVTDYNSSQVEQIARAITEMRNTRILDFRFNTIGQMKMMDSAFREAGILKTTGADYYTTLYDNYLYANNYTRFHGKRWDFGIYANPGFNYWYSLNPADTAETHRSSTTNFLRLDQGIYVGRTVNIATTLKNQFNYHYRLNLGNSRTSDKGSVHDTASYTFANVNMRWTPQLQVGIEWLRYFNTRNSATLGLDARLRGYMDQANESRGLYTHVQSRFVLYHWFSRHLNMRFGWHATLDNNDDKFYSTRTSNVNINHSLQFGFNYAFY